jgi:hypothetical protein
MAVTFLTLALLASLLFPISCAVKRGLDSTSQISPLSATGNDLTVSLVCTAALYDRSIETNCYEVDPGRFSADGGFDSSPAENYRVPTAGPGPGEVRIASYSTGDKTVIFLGSPGIPILPLFNNINTTIFHLICFVLH